jgi:hypothetical protein
MARAKKEPPQETPEFSIYTFSLDAKAAESLKQLSQDASDFLGRTVSGSAIVRALIRQVVKQGPPAADALFIEVEREMNAGVLWGSKKK